MTGFLSAQNLWKATVAAGGLGLCALPGNRIDDGDIPELPKKAPIVVTADVDPNLRSPFGEGLHKVTEPVELLPVPQFTDEEASMEPGSGDPFLNNNPFANEPYPVQPASFETIELEPEFTDRQIQLGSGTQEERSNALSNALNELVEILGKDDTWKQVLMEKVSTSGSADRNYLYTLNIIEKLSAGIPAKHSKEFANKVLASITAMLKNPLFQMKLNLFAGSDNNVATETLKFINKILDAKENGVISETILLGFMKEVGPLISAARDLESTKAIIEPAYKLAATILTQQRDSGNISPEQADEYWDQIVKSFNPLTVIETILIELEPLPTKTQE